MVCINGVYVWSVVRPLTATALAGENYVLSMRLLDHVLDDMVVDEMEVSVVLPEGASDVELEAPYAVTRRPVSHWHGRRAGMATCHQHWLLVTSTGHLSPALATSVGIKRAIR